MFGEWHRLLYWGLIVLVYHVHCALKIKLNLFLKLNSIPWGLDSPSEVIDILQIDTDISCVTSCINNLFVSAAASSTYKFLKSCVNRELEPMFKTGKPLLSAVCFNFLCDNNKAFLTKILRVPFIAMVYSVTMRSVVLLALLPVVIQRPIIIAPCPVWKHVNATGDSYWSSGKCVPHSKCGNRFQGSYYLPNEKFWVGKQCQEKCVCQSNANKVIQYMFSLVARMEECVRFWILESLDVTWTGIECATLTTINCMGLNLSVEIVTFHCLTSGNPENVRVVEQDDGCYY